MNDDEMNEVARILAEALDPTALLLFHRKMFKAIETPIPLELEVEIKAAFEQGDTVMAQSLILKSLKDAQDKQ